LSYKFAVILFIFLLNTPKLFLTTAKPDYTENIRIDLDIDPSLNCSALVWFSFNGLSRPLNFIDFQSELSFISLGINVQFQADRSSTITTIELNWTKVSKEKGRNIADTMIYKLEHAFGIHMLLFNDYSSDLTGRMDFEYTTGFPLIELRDIFLESLPSQGFKQILTSMLSNNSNYNMQISLGKEGGWYVKFNHIDGTKKLVPDKVQIISLKEITGYSGNIVSAPESSSSTINIGVYSQISNDYDMIINPISPTSTHQGYQENMPQYWNYYDITGKTIEDLSIFLTITYSRIRIILLIVLAQITTLIVSMIIIKRHKSQLLLFV
jgi:hypothetical protein